MRVWYSLIFIVVLVLFLTVLMIKSGMIMKNQESDLVISLKKGRGHIMKLTSSSFVNNGKIPSVYTCTGKNVNPPLTVVGVPQDAKSLVLIVDDPDASGGTWVHWVVYNIAPSVKQIDEDSIPQEGIQADTSFGKPGYDGPCPPPGTHHYHFKLYALDAVLLFDKPDQVNKVLVEQQMKEHIIDQADLIGIYSK